MDVHVATRYFHVPMLHVRTIYVGINFIWQIDLKFKPHTSLNLLRVCWGVHVWGRGGGRGKGVHGSRVKKDKPVVVCTINIKGL